MSPTLDSFVSNDLSLYIGYTDLSWCITEDHATLPKHLSWCLYFCVSIRCPYNTSSQLCSISQGCVSHQLSSAVHELEPVSHAVPISGPLREFFRPPPGKCALYPIKYVHVMTLQLACLLAPPLTSHSRSHRCGLSHHQPRCRR